MLKWKGRALSLALRMLCRAAGRDRHQPPAVRRRRRGGGLAATGFAPKAFAQAKPHRIDVHAHVVPPSWLRDGRDRPQRFPAEELVDRRK